MKHITSLLILTVLTFNSIAQSVPTNITTWKDNAKSAYTLTHDDFGLGNVNGIENYADTIAFNRGIKIAFGAVPAQCDNQDWITAKRLISHGHEIMNHSWNHKCGDPSQGSWCVAYGVWDEDDFDVEIVDAHNEIKAGTGDAPRFYIYPFDAFIPSMNTYLINTMNYIGTRTGPYDQGLNPANISDPTYPGFYVTRPETEFSAIMQSLDDVVAAGGWGVREFHGVSDGSWGVISAENYRTMLNNMRQKVNAGDMWVGTPSEVITYIKQRQLYTPTANYANNKITVSFNTPNFNVSKYLDNKKFTSPVTIQVNTTNYPGDYKVYQNGLEITDFTKSGDTYYINAYPIDGNIELTNGCDLCLTKQPSSKTANEDDNVTFSVTATSNTPITYQWYKGTTLLLGKNSSSLTISNVKLSDAGEYKTTLTSNGTTITSATVTLTVFQNTNCGNPICITYQPSNAFVTENQAYTESVAAQGNNLTYQWYKNDTPINNTLTSYTITNTSFLDKGTYKVRISDGTNTVWTNPFTLSIYQSSTQQPYNNTRHIVPGTIEAELFDVGEEGIAYHDNTPGQEVSNDLRTNVDVEVENYGWQKYNIGYTQPGEWLDYSLDVRYDATYTISVRNSSTKTTGKISLYYDDSLIIDQVSLPNTYGWHDYTSTDLGQVALKSGWHTLHLYIDGEDANIDNITFVAETITGINGNKKQTDYTVSPNPVQNEFIINAVQNTEVELSLINTSGQIVYSSSNQTNTKINIEHLDAGIYILQVKGKQNSSTHRIIKK